MPGNEVLQQRTQAFVRLLTTHRILLYCLVSIVAVSAVIANALKNYSNFYSVAIYLAKSSRSVLVLANFGCLLALVCGHIVQKIFFGALRPNEVERLYDRLWFFITESLLAFTIFRDEFDTPFALMFGFLLFVKSFHWLAADRIEWMDQRPYPGPPLLFHIRMTFLFVILWAIDFLMFLLAVESTITNGVGGMVLFASEYGILMASVMNTICKYLLSAYELRRAGRRGGESAPPWENKSMWVFYIELTTDFLKLTTYLVFFMIIITFYGLPLNIIRDVYITARSFITRLQALHRYQTATRNMDQRYPNATEEEMASMSDRTCIICREEMVLHEAVQAPTRSEGPNTTPKKLPCGHVFHFYCLRSWLERQQSCPTCRRTVLENDTPERPTADAARPQAPAQPNPLAFAGGQNQNPQGLNNPLGNPLGFMGRLFGPPAQAQPPGLINQGQLPRANNLQDTMNMVGNLPGQVAPGILVQYQIQYQFPRPQQPHNQGQQVLQPVPDFPGFAGPGGVWRPWPVDGLPHGQPPVVPTPHPTREQENVPTSGVQAQAPEEGLRDTHSTSRTGSDTLTTSNPTPREAAALAALRRLGSQTQALNNTAESGSGSNALNQATLNGHSSPAVNGSSSAESDNTAVPHLIPLYDYSAYGPEQDPLPSSQTTTRQTNLASQASSDPWTLSGNYSDTPLSQLPPQLTDEQLARMDSLTREAIDERLRALEGVSAAVYRCIDDLMRIRSTLPVLSASFPPQGNISSTSTPVSPTPGTSKEPGGSRSESKRPETETLSLLDDVE